MTSTQYILYIDIFIQEKYHIVSRIIWIYDSSGVQSKILVLLLINQAINTTENTKTALQQLCQQ